MKEVIIFGVRLTEDNINYVDDMYVYTKDYQKICPLYEEWEELRKIL